MSAHDRWLADYRRTTVHVWCSNPKCGLHRDGIEVDHESEYGQGWVTPEECPDCNSEWLDDQPEQEDDDEE